MTTEFFNPLTWDWLTVVKTAFGAGIGTAVVQGGLSLYRDHLTKQDHAAYLALRMAVMLEAYTSACFDFVSENANAQQRQDEQYPDWRIQLPTLPDYPQDMDGWRAMDRELVARCLNLPNKIHGSQGIIGSVIEFSMSDDLIDTLDEHASARGLEAWDIAIAIRDIYKLEKPDLIFDYADWLRPVLKGAQESIAETKKRQAELANTFFKLREEQT